MSEAPKINRTMDELEAKKKLQQAIDLIHEIYAAVEDTTIVEEIKASGSLRRVLDIYRRTEGSKIVIDLASSDIPF